MLLGDIMEIMERELQGAFIRDANEDFIAGSRSFNTCALDATIM